MTKEQTELNFLLDLFCAGYKKAYVSVMNLQPMNNGWRERIEIILPNVGRLCLYQKFYDTDNDEQIPMFRVFYTCANNYNKNITLIRGKDLNTKAIKLIYKCKHYFETNEIPVASDDMVVKTALKNSKLVQKMHDIMTKQHRKWFERYK